MSPHAGSARMPAGVLPAARGSQGCHGSKFREMDKYMYLVRTYLYYITNDKSTPSLEHWTLPYLLNLGARYRYPSSCSRATGIGLTVMSFHTLWHLLPDFVHDPRYRAPWYSSTRTSTCKYAGSTIRMPTRGYGQICTGTETTS
eukprot:SAG31_NODE_3432_length_4280_cov_1.816073_2_plen_144_part_00